MPMVPKRLKPYAMIAPALAVFSLFYLYPIGYMIHLSFHEWNFISPEKTYVGLGNYREMLADDVFLQVLRNSALYTVMTVLLATGTALPLALWLNRKSGFHAFVQGAIFSPHIISLVSVSLLWSWLMDPEYGLLNGLLHWFGIGPLKWLNDPGTALLSLVIVAVWKNLGYNTIVFIAGLQSIPPELLEAAALDRSKPWTTFRRIILPMLSPTLFFLVIINLIGSFQVFETIAIMTQGGPVHSTNTLVYYIYEYGFRYFKIGHASAAGVILLVIVGTLTLGYFRLLSRRVHYYG